jgi:hypothetical protein
VRQVVGDGGDNDVMTSEPPEGDPGQITMRVTNSAGRSETAELPGPGGTIRAVVGEPGRQSGAWRIWSPANKCDVYVAVRAIAGYQKWSFHESGDWRFQWISNEKAKEFGIDNRIIDQWQPPDEYGDTGITRGLAIRIRHQDLVEVAAPEKVPNDALWVPSPPEGHLTALHVVIARPDRPEFELTGLVPVAGYSLVDRRAVLLFWAVEPLSDELNATVEGYVAASVKVATENGIGLESRVAPRMALGGSDENGNRVVWDVALPPRGSSLGGLVQ